MIFITLGSQKFQFNRLLKEIDKLIDDGVIEDEVFAQIGASEYIPRNYKYEYFLDRNRFAEIMNSCDTVITHGGTGVIIGAVKKGKRVIAVPRLAKYGEHVDDHQLQLLHQFDDLQLICACYEMNDLGECYKNLKTMQFRPYVSNTDVVIASIDEYLKSLE
ncbi:MAG: beta(1,3)galactosyltransferase EpsH [Lachnospiraceae bacterium]|nr:beta(1,3)galactosyltransferase EpsH [Lachnospiraceae bacterium]